MNAKGFLLVIARPPAEIEEEFNAWYDTEHLPERLAVPGIETGLRYVSVAGTRRYLALYDLERPEVLDGADYARVSGVNFSPWTRRVTGRAKIYRAAGQQVYPGTALTGTCARIMIVRFRDVPPDAVDAIVPGMRAVFETRPEVRQVRVFVNPTGRGHDILGVVESRMPTSEQFDAGAFAAWADAIDLVESFAPC